MGKRDDVTALDDRRVPIRPYRVFLAHNACLNAAYDFNVVREGLRKRGYDIVENPADADEIVFSVCAVRDVWVADASSQINALHSLAPEAMVTVTGCGAAVAAGQLRESLAIPEVAIGSHEEILRERTGLSINEVDRVYPQNAMTGFESAEDGVAKLRRRVGPQKLQVIDLLKNVDREYGTSLETQYRATTKGFVFYHEREPVEFITVTRSCPYRCSFCAIPKGRGPYVSVPLDDILKKAQATIARGVQRLVLVGDEVGNYGAGTTGPKLRDLITSLVDLDPSIRLSIRYLEPKPFAKNFQILERLCSDGRIELLYLSLQSGSQHILDRMNRRYKIGDIAELCSRLKAGGETILYGNWMVGFPGESGEDYRMTRALAKRLDFHINVAIPFSARPDTPAALMSDQLSEAEKLARRDGLATLFANLKRARFERLLTFLEAPRRDDILQAISLAEHFEYREDPGGS